MCKLYKAVAKQLMVYISVARYHQLKQTKISNTEQNPLVTTSNANYPLPGIPDYELSNPLDFASFAEPYILDFALYAAPFSIDFASFAAPSTFSSLNFPPSIPSALSDHEVENSAGLGPSK